MNAYNAFFAGGVCFLVLDAKEQLSVIIRLDKKGGIVERLLKYHDVSTCRSANAIS